MIICNRTNMAQQYMKNETKCIKISIYFRRIAPNLIPKQKHVYKEKLWV